MRYFISPLLSKKYFSYGFGILHLKGDAWEPVTGLMAGDFNASVDSLFCVNTAKNNETIRMGALQ